MVKTVKLGGRKIGRGQPCYIIAEAGVNHNGDIALAKYLIDAAVEAGSDAVKFQSFKTDRLVTRDAPKANYQKTSIAASESQFEMLKRLELTHEMHVELISHCQSRGIQFLSTPFEEESADELIGLGLPGLKLPSGEITNLPFLQHVASKNVPVILSTGMASLAEVEEAVSVFRKLAHNEVILLHCVSSYPAEPADCNLRAMSTMESKFDLPVGFSDHTVGMEVGFAAVALGACVIEKHLTLDRTLPGPDHSASAEPDQFTAFVRGIRAVEAALGDGLKAPVAKENNTREVARKSLVASCAIPAGTQVTEAMIAIKRPGTGMAPASRASLLGRTAKGDISDGTLLRPEMFS